MPLTPDAEGAQFLLVDRQTRVVAAGVTTYRHYVQRVQNESQLAESSEISIDFDPSYQRLTLHRVRVRRGAQELDKLKPSSIQLLQRERELEARVLDGRRTAHLILDDVRVGDVIDYEYTIDGGNPALARMRYGRCDLQYSVPVEHVRCRLLWPDGRDLQTRQANGAAVGQETHRSSGREFVWERRHQPALKIEGDAPAWFDPYPYVEWGDAQQWQDVAAWARSLYKLPAQLGPELARERDAILKMAASPEERVAAALRVVQGQVRYLGIEIGAGSYAPRDPEQVFRRRFGDCKDKALLLSALLRSMDIEAAPALVNTRSQQVLAEVLPSAVQFDHVIVKVRLGERSYWLDPTRATQYGRLDLISQPDFRQALVVDAQSRGLEAMPRPAAELSKRRMAVTIDASGARDQPAAMTVHSIFTGRVADGFRADIARQGHEELQKLYLNFYAGYYPGVTVAQPFEVTDDRSGNEISLIEHYSIPGLWHRPKDDRRLQASIFSGELREFLKASGSPRRQSPYQLAFPVDVEVTSEMRLPRKWGARDVDARIAGPGFEYKGTVRWPEADRVVVTEAYKTLDDEVSARETPEYNDKINRARDSLGYTLYDLGPGVAASARTGGVNWPVLLVALGLVAVLTRTAWRLYRWDPVPSQLADPNGLRGLGGWLVLLGLGLILRTLTQARAGVMNISAYSLDNWSALTTPGGDRYDAWWAPALLLELMATCFIVAGGLLLLTLFFRRRSSFPRLTMGYLWISTALLFADALLLKLLPLQSAHSGVDPGSVGSLIGVVLWTAYLIRSRRVANTFVERLPVALSKRGAPAHAGATSEATGS
ncbi:MAG: DUF3857 domain-containing protein [Paucibacter sp.]|nr:DUF3857 domain-containing protein [Roseateles sp.]